MRLAGYIHRDISPGNCLHINGRAIITDLEFAKPYARVSVHDPRTVCPFTFSLFHDTNDVCC